MRPFPAPLSLIIVSVFAVSIGCTRRAETAPMPDRNVITSAQIDSAHERTAYDLVTRFRSNFLNSRGKNSIVQKVPSEPTVYLDEVEYGPVSSLRSIPASHVSEIRFIEGWDAMTKYGSGHVAGVIQITTKLQ